MTSRRNDPHRAWVASRGSALSALGLPLHIFETANRWSDFLENGHLHFHADPSQFSFDTLTPEQQAALHRFLEHEHSGRQPPRLLLTLRFRAAPLDVLSGSVPATPEEALAWLASRGAHPWLVRHHELVVEAAQLLLEGLRSLRLDVDPEHVLLGAALHDVGKIEHTDEMREHGHAHEGAGEAMLRAAGFAAHIARISVTHASWSAPEARLEDRLVALADKLWKGKRDAPLEDALVAEIAARLGREQWEIFDALDTLCERVASEGPARLRRSNL